MATTNRPSPVMKKAALAVRLAGMSRTRPSASIVVAPGVSTSSIGRRASASGDGLPTLAIWRFAA